VADYRGCFEGWKASIKLCIVPDGNNFEGDNMHTKQVP